MTKTNLDCLGLERGDVTRVIVCCDGLDPEYLAETETPGWRTIADEGRSGVCEGVVPSVTNVNNVSIVTGSYPGVHGITANTYYDPERDERVYMEDPSFIRCPTRLQLAADRGDSVGALVAKDKLRRMVGQGCDLAASAEAPPAWLTDEVGPAPDIYSGQASPWLFEAATHVLETRDLDWLYVSTTDVIPHKFGPTEARATEWVAEIDDGLAAMHRRAHDIVATADHGMNDKTHAIDPERLLTAAGIDATVIRLIRDKHVYHHQNLGGAAYVYVHDGTVDDARQRLAGVAGIELVLERAEAVDRFTLPPDRIGDLMILGDEHVVFGPLEEDDHAEVSLRSHGSHHERHVPYTASRDVALEANIDAFGALE